MMYQLFTEAKLKALEERQDSGLKVTSDAATRLQQELNDQVSRVRKESRQAQTKYEEEMKRFREEYPRDLQRVQMEILSEVDAKFAMRRSGSSASLNEEPPAGRSRSSSFSSESGVPPPSLTKPSHTHRPASTSQFPSQHQSPAPSSSRSSHREGAAPSSSSGDRKHQIDAALFAWMQAQEQKAAQTMAKSSEQHHAEFDMLRKDILMIRQELHDIRDSVNKTVEHRLNSDSVAFQFALQSCQRDSRQQSEAVRELQREVRQMQTDLRTLSMPQLQQVGKVTNESIEQIQKEMSSLQSSVAAANAEASVLHKMFKSHQSFSQSLRDSTKAQTDKTEVLFKEVEKFLNKLQNEIFDVKMQIQGHASERNECQRCGDVYYESENNNQACFFHPSKWDDSKRQKGWLCCMNKDPNAPGCLAGQHLPTGRR